MSFSSQRIPSLFRFQKTLRRFLVPHTLPILAGTLFDHVSLCQGEIISLSFCSFSVAFVPRLLTRVVVRHSSADVIVRTSFRRVEFVSNLPSSLLTRCLFFARLRRKLGTFGSCDIRIS